LRLMRTLLAGLVFFGAECNTPALKEQSRQSISAPTQVVKIKVDQAGEIYVDRRHVTLEELRQELAKLRQSGGGIWYNLEDPSHPQARAVQKDIIDSHLPIKITREKFE
jgi:hypothetical protein